MIFFLDASALAKLYMAESGSSRVSGLLTRKAEIAASRVTFAEVAAAISRAYREERIDEESRDRGLEQLREDFSNLRVVEVRPAIVEQVAVLVVRWPLRGYDAIQLASALKLKEAGAAVDFWCADKLLVGAAKGEGLRATLL